MGGRIRLGHGVTLQIVTPQIAEMRLIKELGANFVRLGHYQQSRTVLDLCDELGLLVWEEVPWCRGGVGGNPGGVAGCSRTRGASAGRTTQRQSEDRERSISAMA